MPPGPTLGEAFPVWLRIGVLSFGGPAGQIALMHRLLVDESRWIDESRFLQGLNFCMLLPGPEAQQLATYIGWRLHGIRGGIISGVLFVLPGALVIFALSVLYLLYADLSLMSGIFFGIKAAVIAIVIEALLRIARRALKTTAAWLLAAASFVAIFVFDAPFPLIVLAAALIGLASAFGGGAAVQTEPTGADGTQADTAPRVGVRQGLLAAAVCLALWIVPVVSFVGVLGTGHVFGQQAVFFSQMAVVTFGGAYAVLAYVAQQAVEVYQWLSPGEMIDGLGLAETTPGPLVLVLQFVGFLGAANAGTTLNPIVAGTLGSLIALWMTFVPCFLWIFLAGPFIETLRRVRALNAALAAVTAAVVGVILNLSIWFAVHVVFRRVDTFALGPIDTIVPEWTSVDPVALALAAASAFALLRLHLGVLPLLAMAAAIGAAVSVLLPS